MSPRVGRWEARTIAVALCAGLVLISVGALALARGDAPFEPNDSRSHATGPLRNKAPYQGAIERNYDPASGAPGDTDWFKLIAIGGRPLKVAYSNLQSTPSCFGPEARLLSKRGRLVGTAQPPKGGTERIRAHPGRQRVFYVRVRGYTIEPCPATDSPYRLKVTGIRKKKH